MGLENYVSESEATQRSGVSLRTLQRFVEAGYLSIEIEPDGLRLYSRKELDEIFGIHSTPLPASVIEGPSESSVDDEIRARLSPILQGSSSTIHSSGAHVEPAPAQPSSLLESSNPSPATSEATPAREGSITQRPSVDQKSPVEPSSSWVDREIVRLKNIIKVQETLLDARDTEVKDLKDERSWLRTRIERLEEKGERDQILLLSETQTIRKLVSIGEQRKSPVKNFLSWVGLLPPEKESPSPSLDLRLPTAVHTTGSTRNENQPSSGLSLSANNDKKVGNG